jgi:hypothetical protein
MPSGVRHARGEALSQKVWRMVLVVVHQTQAHVFRYHRRAIKLRGGAERPRSTAYRKRGWPRRVQAGGRRETKVAERAESERKLMGRNGQNFEQLGCPVGGELSSVTARCVQLLEMAAIPPHMACGYP